MSCMSVARYVLLRTGAEIGGHRGRVLPNNQPLRSLKIFPHKRNFQIQMYDFSLKDRGGGTVSQHQS